MGLFKRKSVAPSLPAHDRRQSNRWAAPGRCPECGKLGKLERMLPGENAAEHKCPSCGHRWMNSAALEQERWDLYRRHNSQDPNEPAKEKPENWLSEG